MVLALREPQGPNTETDKTTWSSGDGLNRFLRTSGVGEEG
jgi:hypothetical protein